MTIPRPSNDAVEDEIIRFARAWMELAASKGFDAALAELDTNPHVPWSVELFNQLMFNHFDDERQPEITWPDPALNLRVDAYEYTDGRGFGVDYDLPLDGKRSDFTVQFEFLRRDDGKYIVYLDDIHVL
jgi:hypothetical protein